MQMPVTVKAVQTFVGMVNYCAPYVPNLAELLIPFNDLVKARTWQVQLGHQDAG